MCNCGSTWVVTYPPDDTHASTWTQEKPNVIAARSAAARVPGATYAKKPKG
jgi:hypothetical protein